MIEAMTEAMIEAKIEVMIPDWMRFPRTNKLFEARSFSGSAFFLALVLASLGLAASARRADAMQLTPVQKLEMKQHYEKATRAYDVQKYSEAVEEYQRAYEIGGDPAMLYNVAQSYRLNDQLAEAQRFYRRYLQRSPNARNREDVEKKIADLEKVIEDRRKKAAAAPPPPPPPPVVVPLEPSPEPMMKRVEPSPGRRIAGIVIASVGVAALVGAAITGKLAGDKADKLTAEAAQHMTFDPNLEANGKQLNKIAIVSVIAGAAAVVTGGVLIVTSRGRSAQDRVSQRQDGEGQQAMISPLFGDGLLGAAATVRF